MAQMITPWLHAATWRRQHAPGVQQAIARLHQFLCNVRQPRNCPAAPYTGADSDMPGANPAVSDPKVQKADKTDVGRKLGGYQNKRADQVEREQDKDVRAGEKDPDFVSASETAEQADDPHTKTLSDYEKEKSS